jgi:hypothetical protein
MATQGTEKAEDAPASCGLEEDKIFVFIAAHLAAQFKTLAATNCAQIEVNHEQVGLLTLKSVVRACPRRTHTVTVLR